MSFAQIGLATHIRMYSTLGSKSTIILASIRPH